MLDLFVVPVCNHHKNLAFVTLEVDLFESHCFFHTTLSAQDNSDEIARNLASKYLDQSTSSLQFHSVFQPSEITDNITLVYRLTLNEPPRNTSLRMVDIDISYDPPAIRTGLPAGSLGDKLGLSVIQYIHDKFIQGVEPIKNKEGFEILISLLPDVFDSTNLRIIYEALSGKSLRTVRMLANSMLESYSIGANKSGKEGRTINGRGLIEELPMNSQDDSTGIHEPMASFDLKYDKIGVRRTTLYRKKS